MRSMKTSPRRWPRSRTLIGLLTVATMVAGNLLVSASAAAEEAQGASAGWRKQYPKLRYGVQSVETQAASLTRYKGFKEYVKKKLGVELELFLASEYAGVIQAIAAKQIDLMDMGASGYAAAWLETKGGVEPLVVPTNNDGTIGYHSVAFVRTDSPYKSLADLKGKTWAWAEPNSSSGYLFPLVGLRKAGFEPDKHFGKVVFSGGHEQSIIGVLDKAYDGAVTWTDDVKKHSRGGLHMMLSRGVLKKEDIRIIWESELIPNPVIAIRSDMPKDMRADVKAMFLNLHKDDPKVFKEVARGESQGYKEVAHSVYQIAIDLRRQLADRRRDKK